MNIQQEFGVGGERAKSSNLPPHYAAGLDFAVTKAQYAKGGNRLGAVQEQMRHKNMQVVMEGLDLADTSGVDSGVLLDMHLQSIGLKPVGREGLGIVYEPQVTKWADTGEVFDPTELVGFHRLQNWESDGNWGSFDLLRILEVARSIGMTFNDDSENGLYATPNGSIVLPDGQDAEFSLSRKVVFEPGLGRVAYMPSFGNREPNADMTRLAVALGVSPYYVNVPADIAGGWLELVSNANTRVVVGAGSFSPDGYESLIGMAQEYGPVKAGMQIKVNCSNPYILDSTVCKF